MAMFLEQNWDLTSIQHICKSMVLPSCNYLMCKETAAQEENLCTLVTAKETMLLIDVRSEGGSTHFVLQNWRKHLTEFLQSSLVPNHSVHTAELHLRNFERNMRRRLCCMRRMLTSTEGSSFY